jgi:hypothetical protein
VIVQPAQRYFFGILAVLIALGSFVTSNLGGFLIGGLMGVIAGGLIFAWTPGLVRKRNAQKPDGGRRDEIVPGLIPRQLEA